MKKWLLFLLMSLIITVANAQDQTTVKTSHYKAAEDLMAVMNVAKVMQESIEQMLDMQVKANPVLATKREAMLKFFKKHMSWEALQGNYIRVYVNEFTEQDIKDLIKFYETPIGKKLALKQGSIGTKLAQLGQEKVQANMAELMEMMQ